MGHRVDTTRAHWVDKTANHLEDDLNGLVARLMKESLALGETPRTSPDYAKRRRSVAQLWRLFEPSLSQLRARSERETRRATRDTLHARLCEIQRRADRGAGEGDKPYIAWKRAIDEVIEWLDAWSK
jgi:hypothetical protein